MTKRKTTLTARQKHFANQNDIARLLDVLDLELQKIADRGNTTETWEHAEVLANVRNDLIDVVATISNQSPAKVEAFLNEAI